MAIPIAYILKNSAKFSVVSLVSKFASLLVGIVTAMVLLPNDYGTIGFVMLWASYANLISPGTCSAAFREMPYLLGKCEDEKARYLQNVSISYDAVFSVVFFIGIVLSALFFKNRLPIAIGLVFVGAGYGINKITGYWLQFNYARNEFNKVAVANIINGIGVPLVTIALIFSLKMFAILLAPVLIGIIAWWYLFRYADIGFLFIFDTKEFRRLASIGLPIMVASVVYWGYRLVDKTLIARYFSLSELGYYSFATVIAGTLCYFFSDFCSVLQPVFWQDLGRAGNTQESYASIKKITVFLALASAITVSISQEGFYLLTNFITKKYTHSIPIFDILAYGIFFHAITLIPSMIMNSSVVNKQTLNAIIWGIGLLLNFVLILLAIKINMAIVWVAAATILTWFVMLILLFALTRRVISGRIAEFIAFLGQLCVPLLVVIFLQGCAFYLRKYSGMHGALSSFMILALQLLVWFIVIGVGYRSYINKKQLAVFWKSCYAKE